MPRRRVLLLLHRRGEGRVLLRLARVGVGVRTRGRGRARARAGAWAWARARARLGLGTLAPFLPYMKLLLSALYQLPLTQVRTYRGVKLELFKVISYRALNVKPRASLVQHAFGR